MYKLLSVIQILLPIFAAPALGIFARRRQLLTQEENNGLQSFVLKFGMPCVLFNSTLTARLQADSFSSMVLLLPFILLLALAGFRLSRSRLAMHNLPMLAAAKESGTLGIPLYMTLFGADQAYRMGVLDLTQAIVVIPVISILSAAPREKLSPAKLAGKVLRSPLLVMSILGLALNATGLAGSMEAAGILELITDTTGFLAQPVSAVILFSAGYSFSLTRENQAQVLKLSALHFAVFALVCGLIQGTLCLLPQVDAMTRWAMLLYCALPPSYLAPSLGHTQEENTTAAGICSMLTIACLAVFCTIAAAVA